MKLRIVSAAIIAVLLSNLAAFAAVDNRRKNTKKVSPSARIVSMLPASDGVAVFDSRGFLNEAMPRILSANQPMLNDITAKIAMIQDRTGIDLKKFDRVAVGVTYKQISAKETDYEPVMIATATDFNFGALIAAAKLVSKGDYRSETVGDRSIFIFKIKPEDLLKKSPAAVANPQKADLFDKLMKGLSKEIAVSAIDKDTLAVGTLPRVRETLEGKSRLTAEMTTLLAAKETAVMTFAMKPPGGMAKLLPLDNDEIGKTIETIRILSGSLDVAQGATNLHVQARTKTPGDALGLRDLLEVGISFGKIAFQNKTRADQQVYRRMIENAKLSSSGADVTINVTVPQSDIDVLIAKVK